MSCKYVEFNKWIVLKRRLIVLIVLSTSFYNRLHCGLTEKNRKKDREGVRQIAITKKEKREQ